MRTRWWTAALLLATLASLLLVGLPIYFIRPFVPQTERGMAVSYTLRSLAPLLTVVLLAAGLVCAGALWKGRRLLRRLGLVLALLILAAMVPAARWSPEETMFRPLPEPGFIESSRASHVEPDDMVLGIEIEGRAKAYPVRLLAYHHVVNDELNGVALVATY
jgi:hypothetical protein